MRKRGWIIFAVVLVLFLCVELYMETHFAHTSVEVVSTDREKILGGMPITEITDDEYRAVEVLRQVPEIEEELHKLAQMRTEAERKAYSMKYIFASAAKEVLKEVLPENAEELSVTISGTQSIFIEYTMEDMRVIFTDMSSTGYGLRKTVAVYGPSKSDNYFDARDCIAVYENDNNKEYKKYVERHIWFAWLKEL